MPLERVYRLLFNRDLYLMAYGKIYRNEGAMTHGVTDETPDGMSLAKIDAIIEALRYERYQWLPARRTYIPKKHGKKRPLGMPVWSDKLTQEVIRLILEAFFEPQFSDHTHGFRPERGCHTALREVYYRWHGTAWFIEGDISQCFDKLNHGLILETISEHIHDGRFINLLRELFDAGYMEEWTFHRTLSGVPQGGIVTPPTMLQTLRIFFRRGRWSGGIDTKNDMDVLLINLHSFDQSSNNVTTSGPICQMKSLLDFGHKVLQPTKNQPQFSL
jgi:retron-type reverse transcriptase